MFIENSTTLSKRGNKRVTTFDVIKKFTIGLKRKDLGAHQYYVKIYLVE